MKLEKLAHNQAQLEKNHEISGMLEKKYGSWLGQRYFEVSVNMESASVFVTVTLRNADKSFFYPIEGRMLHADQELKASDARDMLLDYIDSYIEEFLTGGEETYLPIDWANYECDGVELQLRGQILNIKLEQLADQLINGSGEVH